MFRERLAVLDSRPKNIGGRAGSQFQTKTLQANHAFPSVKRKLKKSPELRTKIFILPCRAGRNNCPLQLLLHCPSACIPLFAEATRFTVNFSLYLPKCSELLSNYHGTPATVKFRFLWFLCTPFLFYSLRLCKVLFFPFLSLATSSFTDWHHWGDLIPIR